MGKRKLKNSARSARQADKISDTTYHGPIPVICTGAFLIASAMALRTAVSLHPYSGEHTPPMFGDFEAQRHWMEIAINVPASDWYKNTSQNDLAYWGLDYPPLSAYASWILGKFVQSIEPAAVQLFDSRGYETSNSRFAMRMTVIIADFAIFFPALLIACYTLYRTCNNKTCTYLGNGWRKWTETFAFNLSLPAMILIDHGHFQYNNISLGLFLMAVASFLSEKEMLGAVMFCSAVYFKQMTLYYAMAVFAFLTSRLYSVLRYKGTMQAFLFVLKIFLAIAVTTTGVFWPWIRDRKLLIQLLRRLFPVSRGLYEDKVANVWCSISILLKVERLIPLKELFKLCACATVLASTPFCIAVAMKPSNTRFLLACTGCSLSAFLFSYHVHEKQILIPLLPLGLLFGDNPLLAAWMSMTAAVSLFPLLLREHLVIAYIATFVIHTAVIATLLPPQGDTFDSRLRFCALLALCVAFSLNIALGICTPPTWAPDIFVLLNTSYACLHLCLIYCAVLYKSFI